MGTWELHDGKEPTGPLDEGHVVRLICEGLPETTVARPVGKQQWKSLRIHAPFAIALEARAAPTAQPRNEPAPSPQIVLHAAPEKPLFSGGFLVVVLFLFILPGMFLATCYGMCVR